MAHGDVSKLGTCGSPGLSSTSSAWTMTGMLRLRRVGRAAAKSSMLELGKSLMPDGLRKACLHIRTDQATTGIEMAPLRKGMLMDIYGGGQTGRQAGRQTDRQVWGRGEEST